MTKLSIIVCAILVIIQCNKVQSANEEQMDEITEFCQSKEKATENDIANWKNDVQPKPRMSKCLDACVGEKLGMMDNKRLNVDAVMKVIEMENTNQQTISDFREIIDECKSVTDPDRCESSFKILNCINDGAKKRGMKEIL